MIIKQLELEKEWEKIIKETHNKPKCEIPYPKKVVFVREMLLFSQMLLSKIENKESVLFNTELYKKIMMEYYEQNDKN